MCELLVGLGGVGVLGVGREAGVKCWVAGPMPGTAAVVRGARLVIVV
ncbi:MAG: hypothetical protein OXF75_11365 [Acidimicrobiaceae bacterium]|nr:hypothetical protein [Acidimicrobiaceae bacterium]